MEIVRLKGFEKVYAVDSFCAEYSRLFSGSGFESRYLKKLKTRLDTMESVQNIGVLLITQNSIYEKLTDENFYSLRVSVEGVQNPRVLFFLQVPEGNYVLLTSFLEKNKTDYTRAKERARKLMKQLL